MSFFLGHNSSQKDFSNLLLMRGKYSDALQVKTVADAQDKGTVTRLHFVGINQVPQPKFVTEIGHQWSNFVRQANWDGNIQPLEVLRNTEFVLKVIPTALFIAAIQV